MSAERGYEEHVDLTSDTRYVDVTYRGSAVLKSPILNKDTAFTRQERRDLKLSGLLPDHVDDIEAQLLRVQAQMDLKTTDLGRHVYLNGLMDRNVTLFYRYLLDNLEQMVPIIYTPTVAEASRHWSKIFRRSRGLYITPRHRGNMREVLHAREYADRPVVVVTDNERILGIGDQGAGGMGIPIGKLALYTAAAGIHPDRTIPICLDVGTNNEELLADPLYVGYRERRLQGDEYNEFIDEFVAALQDAHPGALLQWEDFSNRTSFSNLQRYRDVLPSFNDDIQGTAAMTVAGLIASGRASNHSISDHRVVILGSGSAGIGIHDQIVAAMVDDGLDSVDAVNRVYVLDSKGLVVDDRDDLTAEKQRIAVHASTISHWSGGPSWNLEAVVAAAKPTALIGVSGQAGAFTESVVRTAAMDIDRPVVMPMSNPTSHAEATPEQIMHWTEGRALVATGSPFPPVNYDGQVHTIGQANNVFIFPGMGLGVVASAAGKVTDGMFLAAAKALADELTDADLKTGALYPSIDRVRHVSRAVALAVFSQAVADSVAPHVDDVEAVLDSEIWSPEYVAYRAV
ncbi:MAG: NAD-dependent malic enzyme [Acidimicrobiia bacterium]|nr:NAD-dependent malic enzyme [Acidimicrobiia bacterium]